MLTKPEFVTVTLNKAATATDFARILKNKHLIYSAKILRFIIRAQGLSQQLKAGIYQIQVGETALQLLHRVSIGDVMVLKFSIIEGTNQQKVTEDLLKALIYNTNPIAG